MKALNLTLAVFFSLFIVSIENSVADVSDPVSSLLLNSSEKEIIDYKIVGPDFEGCKEAISVVCSDQLRDCNDRARAESFVGSTYRKDCTCATTQAPSVSDGLCGVVVYADDTREFGAICTLDSWVSCTERKLKDKRWVQLNEF